MTEPTDYTHGATIDASDPEILRHALEAAFDYRGDVTITRKSDRTSIAGYIFDRTAGRTPATSSVRIIPSDGGPRVAVAYDDIAELRFTGRDTAAGKSFDTWMKKYVQKKLAGEAANIDADPLEEGD